MSTAELANQENHSDTSSKEAIREWFDSFISTLNVDQLMIETNIAPKEKSEFYKNLIFNRPEMYNQSRSISTVFFLENILKDYIKELRNSAAHLVRLAFDFSDAKILVWAEVKTDDEQAEDALILSEARTNEKYSDKGFYISSTIVEECDKLKVPPHYSEFSIGG